MKILYIDVNCKINSTGKIVYDLFTDCKNNNIDSAICYGRGPKVIEDNVFKFGLDIETYIHAALTRLTGYTGCFSFFSTFRLLSFIKKFKPDIVHIHELHAYFVNIKPLLKYLKKNRITTVITNHCEFLYTGKCGYSRDCIKYTSECGRCPHLREYPKSMFFDKTKKMLLEKRKLFSDWKEGLFIVSPSKWLDGNIGRSFLRNKNRLIVNNGIDTSVFTYDSKYCKKKYGIKESDKVILFVAPLAFSDVKGGFRFLSIAKHFESTSNLVFFVVGDTSNYKNEIPRNVVFYHSTTDTKVLREIYSLSELLIICSKFENFPTTSLEAQCCGCKVIGYDVGGVAETILEGNGTVVKYNDEKAVVREINHVISNPYNHQLVSDKSKLYYSKTRMFKDYLKIYSKKIKEVD